MITSSDAHPISAVSGNEIPAATLTCREFERQLSESLTRSQLTPPARRHLAACAACAALLEDFELIAQRVRSLPALDVEPVPNNWPQIREALLREGIIHANGQVCASTPTRRAPRLVHRSTSSPRR